MRKKLVDADALNAVLQNMASEPDYQHPDEDWCNGLYLAMSAVDNAPAVDAVEVVRCKDCKSWKPMQIGGICKNPAFSLDKDTIDPRTRECDYCSYGTRR